MKKITKLKLVNFQAHDILSIRLDPKVTTIVGPTDAGKSSIVRAIRWLALNRPSGTGFIRLGSKSARVELEIDGRLVARKRGAKSNCYELDGRKYKALGSGVPDQVASLLNLDKLNFQGQRDSFFWFDKSSGEVSRELNRLINLGAIDRTLSFMAAEVRKRRATVEVCKTRLEQAREEKARLAWVKEAKDSLDYLDSLKSRMEENRLKRSRLSEILEKVKILTETASNALRAKPDGLRAMRTGAEAMELWGKIQRARTILKCIKEGRENLAGMKRSLATAREELARRMGGRCPICGGAWGQK